MYNLLRTMPKPPADDAN